MMPSLSRSILRYEWKRFLAAVVALGFSAFLIYAQVGLALIVFGLENAFLQNARADLWISTPREVKTFFWRQDVKRDVEFTLRMHPGVTAVQSMVWRDAACRIAGRDDQPRAVVMPIDVHNNYLCVPADFIARFGMVLEPPQTAVIDAASARAFKLKIGDAIEVSNKKIRISGITDAYDGTLIAFLFVSAETFHDLFPSTFDLRYNDYILVKLRDPAAVPQVKEQLRRLDGKHPEFQVWTADDLYWKSLYFWLFWNDESLVWIFLIGLALVIGIVITNQSLRAAILATIREYAALRALGLSRRALRGIVLEQTFWVGLAGLALGGTLTFLFGLALGMIKLKFYLPLWFIGGVAGLIMGASLLAGLLAIRVLYQTQPAELLR